MPIKGENGGYKYKTFINGEWYDLTLPDSPNELTEWLQSSEEWTKVEHGHWIKRTKVHPDLLNDSTYVYQCSNCCYMDTHGADVKVPYCWHCGCKMDEVEDDKG